MNCPHCNADLPNGSAFCLQCGNRDIPPIFPAEPQEQQQTNMGAYILIGCAGCGCLACMTFIVLFFGTAFIVLDSGYSLNENSIGPLGSDFPLYGKTLDNEDFDWEGLRGKYVLVKFTATWCGPCKMQIPGMLEAYVKYHDKGFEIVSVYIWEQEPNAVATVKRVVEQEKLPWIILSESLTAKTEPPQGEAFGIQGVPTMVLVNKEGKIIALGSQYRQELIKVFGE